MKIENSQIRLCCGQKGCPTMAIEDDKVKITFDSGNTETMLLSQAEMLPKALNMLKHEKEADNFAKSGSSDDN